MISCAFKCASIEVFLCFIRSSSTRIVKVSLVLTVLVIQGTGGIAGRNLFPGETLVTPEVLNEFTDVISETTSDLGFEANVTQPLRLGILRSCVIL